VVANIQQLRLEGVSIREISRRLGVHRETVGKYLKRLENQSPNPVGRLDEARRDETRTDVVETEISVASTRRTGPQSRCEPFRDLIIERLNRGLTAQKIFQYLVSDHGFNARYYSVRRFVAKLLEEKKNSSTAAIVSPSPQQESAQ
ncbi:MAG: helix-turn-helix domain-containing protein, partial [Schlesneria sp.]